MSSIIFGPIASRRFGKSLGIDLSPNRKQCNFDCLYCELDRAKSMAHYEDVIDVQNILDAVTQGLKEFPDIDVLTVTANGEPTLYPHLDRLVSGLEEIPNRPKLLILSNASTIDRPEIRQILRRFDSVKLSLDCATPRCFKQIDRPTSTIELKEIKRGILEFRKEFLGSLIIEILVVQGINDKAYEIEALNDYLLRLGPDRIDLGSIDRPPAYSVTPLSYEELRTLSMLFDPSLSVHIVSRKDIAQITPSSYSDEEILATLKKRPLTAHDIEILFDLKSKERLENLVKGGKIKTVENNGVIFFSPAS